MVLNNFIHSENITNTLWHTQRIRNLDYQHPRTNTFPKSGFRSAFHNGFAISLSTNHHQLCQMQWLPEHTINKIRYLSDDCLGEY